MVSLAKGVEMGTLKRMSEVIADAGRVAPDRIAVLSGPNLAGVVGRRVGGDPGFDYSPVLEEARQEGRVWDAATLERFLADPEEMFPGLWMGNNGLRAAEDRAAVAAFLQTTR